MSCGSSLSSRGQSVLLWSSVFTLFRRALVTPPSPPSDFYSRSVFFHVLPLRELFLVTPKMQIASCTPCGPMFFYGAQIWKVHWRIPSKTTVNGSVANSRIDHLPNRLISMYFEEQCRYPGNGRTELKYWNVWRVTPTTSFRKTPSKFPSAWFNRLAPVWFVSTRKKIWSVPHGFWHSWKSLTTNEDHAMSSNMADPYKTLFNFGMFKFLNLHFYWAFWLGSLRSDSETTSPRVSRALAVAPYVQIMSNCLAWMWTKDVLHSWSLYYNMRHK